MVNSKGILVALRRVSYANEKKGNEIWLSGTEELK